jgi:hypothetical protein
MFNPAFDSKLSGCDLVRLRVDDVFVGGRVPDRACRRARPFIDLGKHLGIFRDHDSAGWSEVSDDELAAVIAAVRSAGETAGCDKDGAGAA